MSRAFSVIELLIAMAIATIVISGVVVGTVGNAGGVGVSSAIGGKQTVVSDGELNSEALRKAQDLIEEAAATARTNYSSVVEKTVSDPRYQIKLSIPSAYTTQCAEAIAGNVSWTGGYGHNPLVSATTTIVNIPEMIALGGDCATTPPTGGWSAPATLLSRDLDYHAANGDNPAVNSSAGNQGTDIDVLNPMIYMTAGVSAAVPKDDFFVLDATNIRSGVIPPIVGSLETGPGLNALDVTHDSATGKTYAYAVQNDNQYQLQVIDVSTPSAPSRIASTTLPNIVYTCSPASSPCLAGRSIYYYNEKIYIGTQYLAFGAANQNHEFYIFCVAPDPSYPACASSSPAYPAWAASVNVNHNVNAIVVRGHYAYLATSDDAGELTILNLNNLAVAPIKFDATGSEDGDSLYLVGNKLYLGRDQTPASRKDFYILDVGNLPTITELGSKYLNQGSNTYVADITVNGRYAFLALTDQTSGFQVLDIASTTNIGFVGKFNYSENASGIDFSDGFVFTSNKKNDALRIIRPAECSDTIDDDSDGKIDIADPQCHSDGNATNPSSYNPEDDNE